MTRREGGLLEGRGSDEQANQEERAYGALLDWLIDGAQPGAPLPIREFARRLNMSRTPVRAAVSRLEGQGLVKYSNSYGFVVALPTIRDLAELFDLRSMCEAHAIEAMRPGDREAHLDEIESLAKASVALAPSASSDQLDYRRFVDLDRQFHRQIIALSDNARLAGIYDQLNLNIIVLRVASMAPITTERLSKSANEHERIAAALRSGSTTTAVTELRSHIARIRDQTIDHVMRATIVIPGGH